MNISYNLVECRRVRNMTQKELAYKAGISTAMISFIENNRRQPTFAVIVAIARALDMRIDEIVVIRDTRQHQYFR